jgi:hypothetical protein
MKLKTIQITFCKWPRQKRWGSEREKEGEIDIKRCVCVCERERDRERETERETEAGLLGFPKLFFLIG